MHGKHRHRRVPTSTIRRLDGATSRLERAFNRRGPHSSPGRSRPVPTADRRGRPGNLLVLRPRTRRRDLVERNPSVTSLFIAIDFTSSWLGRFRKHPPSSVSASSVSPDRTAAASEIVSPPSASPPRTRRTALRKARPGQDPGPGRTSFASTSFVISPSSARRSCRGLPESPSG